MTGRTVCDVDRREAAGLVAGLALTSASLSSGFVWAYQGRAPLVVAAATGAWGGYLFAHYAVTGEFVDDGGTERDGAADGGGADDPGGRPTPSGWRRYAGILLGVAVLVAGMYVGAGTIRAENHLLTNVGGVLFLGGYVIAHCAATGEPL